MMSDLCLLKYHNIGFRFLRYKCHPMITLVSAAFNVLFSSGVQRTREKIRCISAMSKIDFATVYELLSSLLI
jgi:hypothetical protein